MSRWPFDTVLVANRGEIAVRVIRSIHALGLKSVAVFSEADVDAPHVHVADRAVCIGAAPVAKSYLNVDAIIAAAKATGAGAVHPGYGFLSENAEFAEACVAAGLVFVGPRADAIRAMGNKRVAKERMQAAGVPCIPGYLGLGQDVEAFRLSAANIGYPVMIKAAAGGGGRGMRLVHEESGLAAAVEGASSEARNAFGDGTLYLEKALHGARHVEVQVIADRHGKTLHLGERDCSIQRRHQKIVEESPSPAVDAELRARMTSDAVAAAAAIGYENAGTVEFLLDSDGRYYFLEMNTRLQVEHPVTEFVTGLDLVELQLRVAAGEPLPIDQADVRFEGHAIEVRLCAEDPANGFLPQTGTMVGWQPAAGPGVRVDSGVVEGQTISPYYDSMLAKVIAHGRTRDEARRRLASAIERTMAVGVPTNKDYLARILRHEAFASGAATTDFIARLEAEPAPVPPDSLAAAAALLFCWPPSMSIADWRRAGVGDWTVRLPDGTTHVARSRTGDVTVTRGSVRTTLRPLELAPCTLVVQVGTVREQFQFHRTADGIDVTAYGFTRRFAEHFAETSRGTGSSADGQLVAPMSGRVIRINAAVGDSVENGTAVIVIEAMKMECEIRTRIAGVIDTIAVGLGLQVTTRQVVATVKAHDTSASS